MYECYDEMVFVGSSLELKLLLQEASRTARSDWIAPLMDWDEEEKRSLKAIQDGEALIQEEIAKLRKLLEDKQKELKREAQFQLQLC